MILLSKAYATLLNCWKFLRALSYQVEKGNLLLDGFCFREFKYSLAIEGTVIIDRDVTMDNQQPSPILKALLFFKVGCRSQTKMAVGNF